MRRAGRAERAAGARDVLDDNRLPDKLGELLTDRAPHDVGAAASGERNDDLDRLLRKALANAGRTRAAIGGANDARTSAVPSESFIGRTCLIE